MKGLRHMFPNGKLLSIWTPGLCVVWVGTNALFFLVLSLDPGVNGVPLLLEVNTYLGGPNIF